MISLIDGRSVLMAVRPFDLYVLLHKFSHTLMNNAVGAVDDLRRIWYSLLYLYG